MNIYSTFHFELVNSQGKAKTLGVYGKLTSAYGALDRTIQRMQNRYKRQMLGMLNHVIVANGDDIDVFVSCNIRAHQFRTRKIERHFRIVTMENDYQNLSKPIRKADSDASLRF